MHRVRVSHDQEFIDFPGQCAYCGWNSPEHTFGLRLGNIISDLFNYPLDFLLKADFQVPACSACANRWLWNRRLQWLAVIGFAIALLCVWKFVHHLLPDTWYPNDVEGMKYLLITAVVIVGCPFYGVLLRVLPVPVSVLRYPDHLEFTFEEDEYGVLFEELNELTDDDGPGFSEEAALDPRQAELDRVASGNFDD